MSFMMCESEDWDKPESPSWEGSIKTHQSQAADIQCILMELLDSISSELLSVAQSWVGGYFSWVWRWIIAQTMNYVLLRSAD